MKIVKTSATTPEAPQRHFFSSKTERERGASRIGGAGERTAMSPSPHPFLARVLGSLRKTFLSNVMTERLKKID